MKHFENDYTSIIWDRSYAHVINVCHSSTSNGLKEYFLTKRVKTDTFRGIITYHFTNYGKTLRSKTLEVYHKVKPFDIVSIDNTYWKDGTVDREYKRV